MAKKLRITSFSHTVSGLEVYLDDYSNREEAEEALHELVMMNVDYGVEEVEEND